MDALMMVLAFWTAGVGILFWNVYLPSIKIIRNLEPDNLVVKWNWLCAIIWLLLTTVLLPVLIRVILDDNQKEQFMLGFIPSVMGEKDV